MSFMKSCSLIHSWERTWGRNNFAFVVQYTNKLEHQFDLETLEDSLICNSCVKLLFSKPGASLSMKVCFVMKAVTNTILKVLVNFEILFPAFHTSKSIWNWDLTNMNGHTEATRTEFENKSNVLKKPPEKLILLSYGLLHTQLCWVGTAKVHGRPCTNRCLATLRSLSLFLPFIWFVQWSFSGTLMFIQTWPLCCDATRNIRKIRERTAWHTNSEKITSGKESRRSWNIYDPKCPSLLMSLRRTEDHNWAMLFGHKPAFGYRVTWQASLPAQANVPCG